MNLVELAIVAPVIAVLVTASFSTVVLGAARASDRRREGRSGLPWVAVSVLAGLVVTTMVVTGLAIIVG